jgi:hypothetical protein
MFNMNDLCHFNMDTHYQFMFNIDNLCRFNMDTLIQFSFNIANLYQLDMTRAPCQFIFNKNIYRLNTDTLNQFIFNMFNIDSRGGHAQLCFESAIATPQLEGCTSAITIPQLFKEMLLRNRTSAIPQSQFFLKSATSGPQFESLTSAFFGRFLAWSSLKFYM